jgi:hypothetical protein
MTNSNSFLEELYEYPASYQIAEASDYAQDKAYEYLTTLDLEATMTVEDGEVYVNTEKEIDEELLSNVQVVFDEAFADKILAMGFTDCK